MRIAFASDHNGLQGRLQALEVGRQLGARVIDYGPDTANSVDYPDYAHRVANAVETGEADFGVLVCGTGQGMAMAANRHRGVRAAVITDAPTARMSRAHNDANVACFGEKVVGADAVSDLLRIFLETRFEEDRHSRRVRKIDEPSK